MGSKSLHLLIIFHFMSKFLYFYFKSQMCVDRVVRFGWLSVIYGFPMLIPPFLECLTSQTGIHAGFTVVCCHCSFVDNIFNQTPATQGAWPTMTGAIASKFWDFFLQNLNIVPCYCCFHVWHAPIQNLDCVSADLFAHFF